MKTFSPWLRLWPYAERLNISLWGNPRQPIAHAYARMMVDIESHVWFRSLHHTRPAGQGQCVG